jgi:rod shape-determining protein MreD
VLIALFLNLVPLPTWVQRVWPDVLAVVMVYWGVFQPRRIGILGAFLLGLLMDVADGTLLGQHALAYSVLMFAAMSLHRRIQMFHLPYQVAHVVVILLLHQAVELIVRMLSGHVFPGAIYFVASLTGAVSWPAVAALFRVQLRPRANANEV